MNVALPDPSQPPQGAQASFGALLRQYRLAAGLSQETLAEQAGISVQGLSALENGKRQAPYRHTVSLLARALGLTAAETAALEAAVLRGRRPGAGAALASAAAPSTSEQAGKLAAVAAVRAPAPQVAGVVHPALPADFPPLASPKAQPSNLPLALTSFIGREEEQAAVRALLGTARLVTLTGAGGAGKTRLALAVAGELLAEYPEGVWLVELASLADPALVVQAVVQTLGLREEVGQSLLGTLLVYLKGQHLLLVLDNCEHLVAACAELATALLRGCPHLHILATSREGLGVGGEQLYQVPSLATPPLDHLPSSAELGRYAAVALFVARAQERRTDFALTAQNSRAVAQVCARLDGMPLAIELAAARVGSLPVEAVAARLDDRFRLLTTGPRTAMPRQQTLRATLDWSYDLLSEGEQRLLHRLSVFAGGWTLAAAEAVCSGARIETWEVLDLLGGLVNKSLVLLEEAGLEGEQGRYRLLETVRQYAQEQLAAAGEAAAVRDRHLAYFRALAEEAEPQLIGPEQDQWLDRLEAEHDNLRAALGWARACEAGEEGLRLVGALWRFWDVRGYLSEGRGWLETALASSGSAAPLVRATALSGAGNLAQSQGDYVRVVALHEEALALLRELGDKQGIAGSLNSLGGVALVQGDYPHATALYEESLTLQRELGNKQGVALSLGNLGNVALAQGDYAYATALYEDSLTLQRELGNKAAIAGYLGNVGLLVMLRGDYAQAWALLEEGLALFRDLGYPLGIGYSLNNLGTVAFRQGDYRCACAKLQEALVLGRDIGAKDLVADSLESMAWSVAAQGQPQRAAWLGGAAEALREVLGVSLGQEQRAGHDHAVAAMQAALGEASLAAAWVEGRALPLEAAIALALEGGAGD
jgi:non-specific serine/threonine protein kinase